MGNNKRILKNTLIMYLRMAILLILSLFTARIVFNTLGEINYGIYNLVGGIIIFFSFLNSGLSNATRRYVTAEIETGTDETQRSTFNLCVLSHIFISIVIFILAETIGVWFVNTQLNIPEGREFAANIVYQLSVITAIVNIMQTPFQAVIIAHERMNIYAYFTIFDVIFKLIIIVLIQYINFDKLIVYALLIFIIGIFNVSIYRIYCYRNFKMCKWMFVKNKSQLKDIFSFTGWSLFGQAAVVATNQGVSVLINIFTSVVVNAAMGVANTIVNVVNGFITNFQTAFNPAITKSYVAKDNNYLKDLLIKTSKLSSFLLLIFAIPIIFESKNLLHIWLGDYPQYSSEFCNLSLGYIYLEAISAPLWMLIYSNKNIKRYQIIISSVYFLNIILSWILLFLKYPPYNIMIVRCFVNIILVIIRLIYCKKLLPTFKIALWTKEVIFKSMIIALASSVLPFAIKNILSIPPFISIITTTILSLIVSIPLIYTIGLTLQERQSTINILKKKLHL